MSTLQAERAAWLKVIKLEKEREDREHEKWLKQERERKVSCEILLFVVASDTSK